MSLLLLVSVAPFVASYLAYYVWKPTQSKTHGQLLTIQPLPTVLMVDQAGQPVSLMNMRGKWILLMADGAACDARCQRKSYLLQQVRTAQGKERVRVERLWLVDDTQPVTTPETVRGVHVWRAAGSELIQALPVPGDRDRRDYVYLVDPLGNQVMRYRLDQDPVRMLKEIAKLLKNNEALG